MVLTDIQIDEGIIRAFPQEKRGEMQLAYGVLQDYLATHEDASWESLYGAASRAFAAYATAKPDAANETISYVHAHMRQALRMEIEAVNGLYWMYMLHEGAKLVAVSRNLNIKGIPEDTIGPAGAPFFLPAVRQQVRADGQLLKILKIIGLNDNQAKQTLAEFNKELRNIGKSGNQGLFR